MRKLLALTSALALIGLLGACHCDLCCSTRVPPDPCAPCAPAAPAQPAAPQDPAPQSAP